MLTDLQSALSHQANDIPPVLQPKRVQARLCDHTLGLTDYQILSSARDSS